MKKSTVLLTIVLLLNLSACTTKIKDKKTSGFQQPKAKVTFAQQKENPPLAVFQRKDVKNIGLISMKIKDNKAVMKLNFVQILKAMERTKIDMDKEWLMPLLLDDEAKKDIDYQMIINYRDGSNEIYLI
ncbi:hypothetical protein [Bacillus tropicus]|uniref:hypothetical protein n=1 Tax=Bacillus tropicus TaxID=2026188 RepID=UPI00207AA7A8|nr:hypothetical protein [Bacillus tropicus]USK99801.1 hypothetical protein LIS81_27420 [Bacillus tropicus]